ncbi:MAG: class I SAM-dependent methyltransferase [Ginsengibacter sp.]
MYSAFQLTKKYIKYFTSASNGKGHGVHSPFVFDFINNVLLDKKSYPSFDAIEKRRAELLNSNQVIEIEDFGAGSTKLPFKTRVVKDTAKLSLKSKKYSQLMFRIVRYFKSIQIVELGTSFGVTTSYMACATQGKVHTFEGASSIADIAKQTFQNLGLTNIEVTEGDFAKTLERNLKQIGTVDLAFLDGNHRKEPTLEYFELFKKYTNEYSVLIFDDIHWSEGMEEAWKIIKNDPKVTLTIDLFFIGIVFFRNEFKEKQDFVIRF